MNGAKRSTGPAAAGERGATAERARQRERRDQPQGNRLAMLYCPNCSQRLEGRSCRLWCNRCGYFMDCSDYY